jgi:hypothetical protein
MQTLSVTSASSVCKLSAWPWSASNSASAAAAAVAHAEADSFEGMGEDQVAHGTQHLDNLIAGLTETVTINGIQMESRVKKGKSVTTGGSCPTCPTSTVSTRTLRSRDLLVGCVVRIKVGGKVVRTEASSQALIKRYQAQFPSEVPAGS